MDLKTPINASLTAFYKRSFAYLTVNERIPKILTELINTLKDNKQDILKKYGLYAGDELKLVIKEITKLKREIRENKPIIKIEGTPDADLYNQFLEEQSTKIIEPTSFNSNWLHLECYFYRRLSCITIQTQFFTNLDLFTWQKEESFTTAVPLMIQLGSNLNKTLSNPECEQEKEFINLLKLNLWGNKCDLSISCGVIKEEVSHVDNLETLNSKILSDSSEDIWNTISNVAERVSSIVDIVLDNTGYEFFSDMCLADFIIKMKLAQTVRFYVKSFPWFISDVTKNDFDSTLRLIKSNKNGTLKKIGDRWLNYLKKGSWKIETFDFWTLPYTYKDMRRIDPDLYKQLGEAKIVIFKGDLNYRKLVGDKNWLYTTPFKDALQGFYPTVLCTLRTLKADLVCGLKPDVAEEAEKSDKDWLINGSFGVIQFSNLIEEYE
ncbi:damage-control phosphatase ARMT1-like [Onthophagus taurus]|uniref:damage-control phosphatase ARMT1-like n=1 Tax=Onthophagus taurus TaxID=166361 RepID=UPI0039BE2AF3